MWTWMVWVMPPRWLTRDQADQQLEQAGFQSRSGWFPTKQEAKQEALDWLEALPDGWFVCYAEPATDENPNADGLIYMLPA